MFQFLTKITKYKKEKMVHSQGKKKLETITEEFQTLELLVKNIKSTVLYMLKLLKTNKQNPPLCDTELMEVRRRVLMKS